MCCSPYFYISLCLWCISNFYKFQGWLWRHSSIYGRTDACNWRSRWRTHEGWRCHDWSSYCVSNSRLRDRFLTTQTSPPSLTFSPSNGKNLKQNYALFKIIKEMEGNEYHWRGLINQSLIIDIYNQSKKCQYIPPTLQKSLKTISSLKFLEVKHRKG